MLKASVTAFEADILAGTISQYDIAMGLGCSQAHVSLLHQKLGYPSLSAGCPDIDQAIQQKRTEYCEKFLGFIETPGSYLNATRRELGYPDSSVFTLLLMLNHFALILSSFVMPQKLWLLENAARQNGA